MKRSAVVGSVFGGLMLLLSLGRPAPAQAEVISNVRFPFSIHTTNLCNGEGLDIPVEAHVVSTVTFNEAGGSSAVIHFNAHGSGVGSMGNEYIVNEVDRLVVTANPVDDGSGQSQFTDVFTFRAVGKGSVPDIVIRTLMHLTFNENGELTAVVLQFETSCSNG